MHFHHRKSYFMTRALACLLTFATLTAPIVVEARPGGTAGAAARAKRPAPTVNQRDFATDYQAAQSLRNAGDYLGAARAWRVAAKHLPGTREHLTNRANLHRYMAEDYTKVVGFTEDAEVVREAIEAIDEYTTQLTATFPDEAVPEDVARARNVFQERLSALEAPPSPLPTDPSPPTPIKRLGTGTVEEPDRAGRRLQLVGGASIGVGTLLWLTLVPVGYARESRFEQQFEATTGCVAGNLMGECEGIAADRTAGRNMAIAGWIVGPAFLAAGVTMLVVGTRRKRAGSALVPTISRTELGLSWQGRF